MLQQIGKLIKEVKQHLPAYLKEKGIQTDGRKLFKCPNFKEHSDGDAKPSCNFFPDTNSFHCFSCDYKYKSGDIFDAVHLLEGKDITGENFPEAIKYLCKKYKIPFTETTTEEEKFFKSVSTYLTGLVEAAHKNLTDNINSLDPVKELLVEKQWLKGVDKFQLGYLSEPYRPAKVDSDILSYLSIDPTSVKQLAGRLIIPIRNRKGKIVGITTRLVSAEKDSPNKYKHFIAYNLKQLLFNADKIDSNKEVTIVEGPSSVLTLDSFGITNVVATFGNLMDIKQYEVLIKKKVVNMCFMYDGDAGGAEGLRNSLEVMSKGGISTDIAFLEDGIDPGDYVIKNKKIDKVPRTSMYTYLVETYGANTQDKQMEKCLINHISSIEDLVRKEKVIGEISKSLKINKSTITDLMAIYEKGGNVNMSALMKERESLIETITGFEKWSWSRGEMLGLKSYKSFDTKLDGIQDGLILVAGKPNIGKSALLISIAMKILQLNPNPYLLYFTIDDSMYTTLSRFIACLSGLPINVVSNPNFKITKANLPEKIKQDYINRREEAINFLRKKSSIINLKDSDEGATVEQIKEKIKTIAPLAQGKDLVVVIDNLHNLRSSKFVSENQMLSTISNELNRMCNEYKCPIIASTHITKESMKSKQYDGIAVKGTVELFYDAKLIVVVDSEMDDVDGSIDDLDLKVVITKNKFSSFKGVIPMRFYRSISKVDEDNIQDVAGKESDLFE